jgi:hypothetical protein
MYDSEDNDGKFSNESPVEVATPSRSTKSRVTASSGH